jgi:DNA-binding winged helix-turn-helix (wHTH) protein
VVDVYINYLRRKIDHGFEQALIQTVRGEGYRMAAPVMMPAYANVNTANTSLDTTVEAIA